MKKHIHEIYINRVQKRYSRTYGYTFGHTKDVRLSVSHGAARISVSLGKVYDRREMLSQGVYLFPDAIKKALLLHLLIFSENIAIKTVYVRIDGEEDCVVDTRRGDAPPLYSMAAGRLLHPFAKEWSDAAINGVLSQTKAGCDSRLAALFALILSKNREFETERFIYLWMAFNGMYGYFSMLVAKEKKLDKIRKEHKQIEYFIRAHNLGGETVGDEKDKITIARKVAAIIRSLSFDYAVDICGGEGFGLLLEKVRSVLIKSKDNVRYKIEPYGYLLAQFSYYFRCNFFHADRPLALFSFSDDNILGCIQLINALLEDFIDKNLPDWFDSDFLETTLKSRAKKACSNN